MAIGRPLRPVVTIDLSTLLLDPLFNETAVQPMEVSALSAIEAYAEKVRATLTRRDPAPRDHYDLHHAVNTDVLVLQDEEFLKLAALKMADEPSSDWLAPSRVNAANSRETPCLIRTSMTSVPSVPVV